MFSLLFRLSELITAILMMRILIQFVSQAAGVMLWHKRQPGDERPYKMPWFPVPALISMAIWLFIFLSNDVKFMLGAVAVIVSGAAVYWLRKRYGAKESKFTS